MSLTEFTRHCQDCDVEWVGVDGDLCWLCGEPGRFVEYQFPFKLSSSYVSWASDRPSGVMTL